MARILHVDDRKDWTEIVHRLLSGNGHVVTSCNTLKEAQSKFSETDFDLVICDGSVEETDDGLNWAQQLAGDGIAVTVLSSGKEPNGIPFLDKGSFGTGKPLVQMINQLVAA